MTDQESSATTEQPGIGLLELATLLLDGWKRIAGLAVAGMLVALAIGLLMRPLYRARATFVPETKGPSLPSGLAGLAGLAGQFGLQIGGQGSRSPYFYGDLLRSREVMTQVLQARYERPRAPGDTATLIDILGIRDSNERRRLEKALRRLDDRTSVIVDEKTSVVSLAVEMPGPELAAAVANRFVAALDSFNQVTRRSQGRARRQFVESRSGEAQRDLADAEEAVRVFRARNRSYQGDPQLELENARLERRVQMRQELFLSLSREYEQARIEEVNDTPVITVMDAAVPPARKAKPRRAALLAIGVTFGVLLGALITLLRHYATRLRERDAAGFQAAAEAWTRMRAALRRQRAT